MADINLKQGGSAVGLGTAGTAQPGVVSVVLKGSDAAAAKGSALAANDIIFVADIPAKCTVGNAMVRVLSADTGTTLTFDLGDATAADEWVDGVDGTTAGDSSQGTNGVFDQVKYYASADVLDLKIASASAAADDWIVEVLYVLTDYSGNPRVRTAKDAS